MDLLGEGVEVHAFGLYLKAGRQRFQRVVCSLYLISHYLWSLIGRSLSTRSHNFRVEEIPQIFSKLLRALKIPFTFPLGKDA